MAGILSVCDEELVSSDFRGDASSAAVDAKACVELNSRVSLPTRRDGYIHF
jgi:glyceraldehyde-3-phosphate dehydrogenase/erythrose-4-phosphate dehydrogenase